MRQSKVYCITDEEFKDIILKSYSYSDCLRNLGLSTRGGSSTDILKRRICELGCDTSHFTNKNMSLRSMKYTLDEILVKDSTYLNMHCLKKRLLDEKYIEYKCKICCIDTWVGQPISLQLDHINGINNDHRIENLRLLCPNCHSLTDTFAGKNKKK